MQIQSVTSWNDHVLAGRKYLKTAERGRARPSVFNNELIFQLAAMAIEKMIVGVYQYRGRMPSDHTLSGLVVGLAKDCPIDAELVDRIKYIEKIDDMCTLSPVHRNGPSDLDVRKILDVGHGVACYAKQYVPWENLNPGATSQQGSKSK